jgi:hypothetical protein
LAKRSNIYGDMEVHPLSFSQISIAKTIKIYSSF